MSSHDAGDIYKVYKPNSLLRVVLFFFAIKVFISRDKLFYLRWISSGKLSFWILLFYCSITTLVFRPSCTYQDLSSEKVWGISFCFLFKTLKVEFREGRSWESLTDSLKSLSVPAEMSRLATFCTIVLGSGDRSVVRLGESNLGIDSFRRWNLITYFSNLFLK